MDSAQTQIEKFWDKGKAHLSGSGVHAMSHTVFMHNFLKLSLLCLRSE
jgi:hypothetical protein